MQEVEAICQKIIIINKGKVVADGTTQEVMAYTTSKGESILVEFLEEVDGVSLQKIAGVKAVSRIDGHKWILNAEGKADIRPNVFRFAVENKYTIITLQQKNAGLEEIFQNITANN